MFDVDFSLRVLLGGGIVAPNVVKVEKGYSAMEKLGERFSVKLYYFL